MKKLPFLMIAALILTASCSKSDDNPAPRRTGFSSEQESSGNPSPHSIKEKPRPKVPHE